MISSLHFSNLKECPKFVNPDLLDTKNLGNVVRSSQQVLRERNDCTNHLRVLQQSEGLRNWRQYRRVLIWRGVHDVVY